MIQYAQDRLVAVKDPNIRENVDFIHADMSNFSEVSDIDVAVICFGTINFLMDSEKLREALWCVRQGLTDLGSLLIEFNTQCTYETENLPKGFVPWKLKTIIPEKLRTFHAPGSHFSVETKSDYQLETQLLSQTRRFRIFNESGEVIQTQDFSWENWIMTATEIKSALDDVGFRNVNVYGDYDLRKPYNAESPIGVITCDK